MDTFTSFVLEHENDDPADLVLRKGRWPDIDVELAAATVAGRRKMRSKAPSWYACPEVVYPSGLSVEQCSSEATCEIKLEILRPVADRFAGQGLRIADLTGGLGMDSRAFSKFCSRVLYIERDSKLAEAARRNFAVLGCDNVEVVNAEVTPEGIFPIPGKAANNDSRSEDDSDDSRSAGEQKDGNKIDSRNNSRDGNGGAEGIGNRDAGEGSGGWDVLREFRPDIIYLDPSRRSDAGDKVFKLEDCRPDILTLKDILLELAPTVMVKLSPMADIDMVARQLGPCCRRIDIISIDNECKELLVTMVREDSPAAEAADQNNSGHVEDAGRGEVDYKGHVENAGRGEVDWRGENGCGNECLIVADCGKANSFSFRRGEEATAVPRLFHSPAVSVISGGPAATPGLSSYFITDPRPTTISDALAGKLLLEPDKAMMKAGPFKLLSSRLGLTKLDTSTHYYICDSEALAKENPNELDTKHLNKTDEDRPERLPSDRPGKTDEEHIPSELFRKFRILRVEPLNKKSIKAVGQDFPGADITARNIPLSSAELRKRLASATQANPTTMTNPTTPVGPSLSGTGTIHIFGLRAAGQNLLLVTEKLR